MASEQLKLVIDVATAQAVKETKNLAKAVQNVGTEEADLRSAADRTADALDAAATAMIADLKRSESAAAALGRSLGPELAGKIGEAKIDSFIGDLRRMGLTFEEIEGNSDRFATSLRKMDDATGSIQNVEGAVTRLGHESDNSRSVLANMVGNSVQDLGQLGGVAGSAGVMIGQLAEYAADGNISLSGLAATAGPMVALGVAVAAISSAMADSAADQKFLTDQTQFFIDALINARKENTSATSEIVKGWEKAGKIEAQISNATATLVEFGYATDDMAKIHELAYPTAEKHVIDLGAAIDQLNMNAEDLAKLAQLDISGIQSWGAEMVASGMDAALVNQIMQGAVALHERLAQGEVVSAINARLFGEAAVNAMQGATDAIAAAADGVQVFNDKIAAAVNLQGAYLGTVDSLVKLREVLDDGKKGWLDQQQAINGAQSQVIAYLDQLGGVPLSKKTEILALLDQGNVDGVVAVINEIVKPRSVYITMYPEWGGPMGTNPGYKAGQDFANDFNAAASAAVQAPVVHHSGGGGGGGKSGKTPAETEAEKAEKALKKQQDIEDNKYQLGLITDAKYKDILQKRLAREEKYSDEYTRIAMQIRGIDDKTAKAKAEHDRKAHEAAQKAKKDREDAKRAAEEELQRRANEAIVNANILGASYANIYTSADPNAVVNAIQQWQRRNGPVPIKVTG